MSEVESMSRLTSSYFSIYGHNSKIVMKRHAQKLLATLGERKNGGRKQIQVAYSLGILRPKLSEGKTHW